MRVQCVLCDRIDTLDDESPLAKKLRNRPVHTYMCKDCHERISLRTKEKFAKQPYFIYHRKQKKKNDW
ncbi:MAG TPA: YlaI family protein [Bacillales bacterium]|nr:YlaI family protein [Bacillales bacterium]